MLLLLYTLGIVCCVSLFYKQTNCLYQCVFGCYCQHKLLPLLVYIRLCAGDLDPEPRSRSEYSGGRSSRYTMETVRQSAVVMCLACICNLTQFRYRVLLTCLSVLLNVFWELDPCSVDGLLVLSSSVYLLERPPLYSERLRGSGSYRSPVHTIH